MSHGKGFARQGPVKDDAFEKLLFFHAVEQKADRVFFFCKREQGIFVVNKVDRKLGVDFAVVVNKGF